MFDNTGALLAGLDVLSNTTLRRAYSYAVSFSFLESDPMCGSGEYELVSFSLALSLAATGPAAFVSMLIGLYSAAADGTPQSSIEFWSAYVSVNGSAAPAYITFGLPDTFVLDISAAPTARYAIFFQPQVDLLWYAPAGATVPATGFGQAVGSYRSTNAGAQWSNSTLAAVRLVAIKAICSPTPTQTSSSSQTQTQTPSVSASQTGSPSNTATPSQTLTRSPTGSASPSGTPSQTETQSPSLTRTASQTPSATGSPSPTQTPTVTLTPSPSGTASTTASETRTASQTPSSTASGTRTASNTASLTQSASQTQSPSTTGHPNQLVFSNTGGNAAGVAGTLAIDASTARALDQSTFYGVSWKFPEVDPECGPGTYVLTALTLALSAPAAVPVSLFLALYRNAGAADSPTTSISLTSGLVNAVNGTTPAYYTVPLPATFSIDTSADTVGVTTYTVIWKPQPAVTW